MGKTEKKLTNLLMTIFMMELTPIMSFQTNGIPEFVVLSNTKFKMLNVEILFLVRKMYRKMRILIHGILQENKLFITINLDVQLFSNFPSS